MAWGVNSCTLYRHFAADGRLLYVGISLNALGRLDEHSNVSKWYPLIRIVTLEHYDSVEDARMAEMLAIAHEHPLHNIRHVSVDLSAKIDELTIQDVL
jgi:hypothetical protein